MTPKHKIHKYSDNSEFSEGIFQTIETNKKKPLQEFHFENIKSLCYSSSVQSIFYVVIIVDMHKQNYLLFYARIKI